MRTEVMLSSPVREISLVKRFLINLKSYKFIYFLMLPGILYFIIFHYYTLYFLQAAFKKYNVFIGLNESPWIGFQNFIDLFHTKYFIQAFRNTLILSFMYKLLAFPIPIIFSLLMNELRNHTYKRTVQTLVYLPHFLSWVIVGGIWMTLLSPEGGLVNELLNIFGIKPVFFMADNGWFRWVLLATHAWKETGWQTIIFLAAIAGIDQEMYEAAIVDGASRLKQILFITLPCLLPTIAVVFLLSLAKILNLFEQVFVMYNPVVAEVSETIDTYVYKIGIIKGDLSFGMAVGLFKNSISLMLMVVANWLVKKYQGFSII